MTLSPPEITVVDLCSSQESDNDYNHTVGSLPRKRKGQELDEDAVNSAHREKRRRNFDGSIPVPSTSGLNVQNTDVDTHSLDSASSNETELTRLNLIKLTERVMKMERAMENGAGTKIILSEENLSSRQTGTELLNGESENVQKEEFKTLLTRVSNIEERLKTVEGTMQRLERNDEKFTMIIAALKSVFSDIPEESENEISSGVENRIPESIPETHKDQEGTKEQNETPMSTSTTVSAAPAEPVVGGKNSAVAQESIVLPFSNQGQSQQVPIQKDVMIDDTGEKSVENVPVRNNPGTKKQDDCPTRTTISASPTQLVEREKNPAVFSASNMQPDSHQELNQVRTSTTFSASPAPPVVHGKNRAIASAMCATATLDLKSTPVRNGQSVPNELNELVSRTTVSASPTQQVVGGKNLAVAQQSSMLPNMKQGQDRPVPTHKGVTEGTATTRHLPITHVKNIVGSKKTSTPTSASPLVSGKNPAVASSSNLQPDSNQRQHLVLNSSQHVATATGLEPTPRNHQLVTNKQNELPRKTSSTISASPAKPVVGGKNPAVASSSNLQPDSNQRQHLVLNSSQHVATATGLEPTPRNHQLVTNKQNELPRKTSSTISASPAKPVVGGKNPAVASSSNRQPDSNQRLHLALNSSQHVVTTTGLETTPRNQLVTNKQNELPRKTSSTISASPAKPVVGGKNPALVQQTSMPTNSNRQDWHVRTSTPTKLVTGNAGKQSLQSTPAKNNQNKQNEPPIRTSATISVVPTQQVFAPVASRSNMQTDSNQGLSPHVSIQKKIYSSTPNRVLPSNAGTQCIQSSPARIYDQSRTNAVLHPNMNITQNCVSERSPLQVTPPLNICIKQELIDSLERPSEVNPSFLNPHTDGRIHIFIYSSGKKIRTELDKYVAQYGVYFIHNDALQFVRIYLSDLKTTDVKRQAAVLAANHAVKELESRVGRNLCATIITKFKGLVTFMNKHKKLFQDKEKPIKKGDPCQCVCRPVCQNWNDHLTKEHFSSLFQDDMLLLINRVKNLDIEWVQEDSDTKLLTRPYKEKVIQIFENYIKNKDYEEFIQRVCA